MSAISIKQLLEAGVHFGHQTSRWNPKMKEYIFGERNGIHIIDLQRTLQLFREAVDFLNDLGTDGKHVLFVGTKRQAHEAIEEDSQRCGMHFVTNRWLGGLLTNFETVRNSIKRYKHLEELKEEGYQTKFSSKKEIAKLERERKKLEKNLRGIRNMDRLPDALFVIDSDKEAIAVKEANRLRIPVVAVVDTNCDPDVVDYVIPGNDDALRSVKLFTAAVADAVAAGRTVWESKVAEERKAREQAEKEEAVRQAAARAAAEARRAEREKMAAEAAAKAKAERAEAKAAAGEKGAPVQAAVATVGPRPSAPAGDAATEKAKAAEATPAASTAGEKAAASAAKPVEPVVVAQGAAPAVSAAVEAASAEETVAPQAPLAEEAPGTEAKSIADEKKEKKKPKTVKSEASAAEPKKPTPRKSTTRKASTPKKTVKKAEAPKEEPAAEESPASGEAEDTSA